MKLKIDKWEWHLDDPEILRPWFPNFREIMATNTVKANTQRDVFHVETDGGKYFVKFFHPTSLFQKTRSNILPKALSEMTSAKLLSSGGIKTPRIAAWGKKGSESMLVSEAVIDAPDARRYWFSGALSGQAERKKFLDKFSEFLRKFLDSGLYHPDFHLGNILVSGRKENISFVMIDPYGVVRMPRYKIESQLRMLRVIGAFRGELADAEATDLLRLTMHEHDHKKALLKWHRILRVETARTSRLWIKRAPRILTDPRYSRVFPMGDTQVRVRLNFASEPCIGAGEAIHAITSGSGTVIKFRTHEEAERLWVSSYLREFHRLPQRCPLAWTTRDNSQSCEILLADNDDITLPLDEVVFRERLAVKLSGVFSQALRTHEPDAQ